MLPWWGWVVLWALLLVGSATWLWVLARRLWDSAKVLAGEVERAGILVAELEARADALEASSDGPREVDEPRLAVVRDPREVRAERRAQRRARLVARQTRRADRLPPWARVH